MTYKITTNYANPKTYTVTDEDIDDIMCAALEWCELLV